MPNLEPSYTAHMHTYPLLNRSFELYKKAGLDNVLLLACQHLLEPQKNMFELLLKLGLKPENCVIVGKNYSTNTEVMEELQDLGCAVAPFSLEFDPLQSFDHWFEAKLTAFIAEQINGRDIKSYDKIIVLDDGGHMHIVVDSLCSHLKNVNGIEQTSSGHHRIEAAGIRFPTVSVARSWHKLMLESPYIGRVGCERILRFLRTHEISDPNILTVGLGHIGRQIAKKLLLDEKFRGAAFDSKPLQALKSDPAPALKGMFDLFRDGHIIDASHFRERIHEFDVIIGTTGTSILQEEDMRKLHPKVSLISMSSSDREFPAASFRHRGGSIHEDYNLDGRTLANGGFPITFRGEKNCIPPSQIELTIALLFIHILDKASDRIRGLAQTIEEIRSLWQPDQGAEEWYREFNNSPS